VERYQDEAAAGAAVTIVDGGDKFIQAEDGSSLNCDCVELRSFRAAGTSEGQCVAKLLDQEGLPSVVDPLGSSSLAWEGARNACARLLSL
jgi:hypothetical protein